MKQMEAQNAQRRSYQVVIAATRDMGIGIDMKLPWDLPNEFQFFQDVTSRTSDPRKRNATIMGRKSWEATPLEFRPLPDRLNVVLTRSNCHSIPTDDDNVMVCGSMESALELLAKPPYSFSIEKVFFIGGGELLRHYMNAPSCDAIHLTEVDLTVPCDTFAPRMVFERHEEFGYLNLVQNIISNGDMNDNNTLLSKFGCQKVFWVGVVKEILQLISGSTYPKEKGINHICESDKAKEYLDSFGVNATEEDGDHPLLTGLYWSYSDASQEFSQISDVINKIKNNPHDRGITLSACKLSISPCQTFAQFYVANGELSCQIYQSSTEASLGIPFSIAAYSLLTCIMAHVCDVVAGDFIHLIGDAHVNTSHTKAIQRQLQISQKPFPILKINPEKTKIDHLEASDLDLLDI
ncbi:hypothetical protein HID58_052682 [Brassica napus]|uniref:DHFR domain-containing protein n=1 Tax=Brassica napus TaxID=3708 RepID=A0ABQ8ACQ8_BRANA|nr:hypothetical protein HID58_052682 [Brassica napus]